MIFRDHAPQLFDNGFSIFWANGKRALEDGWQTFRERQPTEPEFQGWVTQRAAMNIGLPMGPFNGLVAFDLDFGKLYDFPENHEILNCWAQLIADLLPQTPFTRVGRKFWAKLYRFTGQLGGPFSVNGVPIGDFITQGQIIIPPSVHPDTGQPYVWTGGHDLKDYDRDEVQDMVPDFTERDFAQFKAEIEAFIDPKMITTWPEKPKRKPGSKGAVNSTGEGRNNELKKPCMRLFDLGYSEAEAASELIKIDLETYGENALFSDASEFPAAFKTPDARALKYVTGLFKTGRRGREKSGEPMPVPRAEREASVEADQYHYDVPPDLSDLGGSIDGMVEQPVLQFTRAKDRTPHGTVDNAMRAIEFQTNIAKNIWFDEFYQKIFTRARSGPREWTDTDDTGLTVYLQRTYGMTSTGVATVAAAVALHAQKNRRNAPRDWLDGLVWDQVPRINDLFERGFGAMQTDFVIAASKNFMLTMVARIYRPGCKVDNMVVLEGSQGKYKSTALNVLGGDYFMESTATMGTIDFLQSLSGKMLVEIAELDGFRGADARTVKKTVTCQVDRYRGSYARYAKDFPRQCVFVGTTNEDEYLEDATGGRRFWPILTRVIDLDWIRTNREQLFAEAVHRYKAGESWWEMPTTSVEVQAQRRRKDAWEDPVVEWVQKKFKKYPDDTHTLQAIAEGSLDIPKSRLTKADQMRLSAILRAIGCEKRHTKMGSRWAFCAVSAEEIRPQDPFPMRE